MQICERNLLFVNFLVKKFVLSIIIRIFAASVLAKPLNNAQIVRGVFYLYTFEHGKFNEIEKIEIAIRRAVMQITADMMGNPLFPYFFANFLFFFPNLFPNQLCLFPNFLHTPHETY